MLKKLSILAMALCLGSGSLFALVHPRADQCECWGVEGEYLYWLPSIGNTEYVLSTNQGAAPVGTLTDNPVGFHSGFRVEGAYGMECGGEIHGRYAWLYGSSSKKESGPFLWAVLGEASQAPSLYAGSATSDIGVHYQNAELLFSRRIWDSCSCSQFWLFGGLDFYYAKVTENISYIQTTSVANVNLSEKHYGIGPEFGLEFAIPLNSWMSWCGCDNLNLSVVGQAYGALLAQQDYNVYLTGNTAQSPLPIEYVKTHRHWRVIPSWNARAGLAYEGDCCCINYKIEIGYEFTSYVNALKKISNKTGGFVFYDIYYYDLSLQGLYVALGLTF